MLRETNSMNFIIATNTHIADIHIGNGTMHGRSITTSSVTEPEDKSGYGKPQVHFMVEGLTPFSSFLYTLA